MDFGDIFVAGFIVFTIVVAIRRLISMKQFVREWAERRGYVIVRKLPTWYRLSPFLLAGPGSKQSFHYLIVRDREGKEHKCWLKVGDWLLGHLSDEVHAVWEGEPPSDWVPTSR